MDKIKEIFSDYLKDSNLGNYYLMVKQLTEYEFKQQDLNTSPRVLGHWFKNNLLSYDVKENKNHRFDIFELFWIWIIEDLRKFGYSIPLIKKAKEQLMEAIDTKELFKDWTYEEMAKKILEQHSQNISQAGVQIDIKDIELMLKKEFEDPNSDIFNANRPLLSLPMFEFMQDRRDILLLFDQEGGVNAIYRDQYALGEDNDLFSGAYISLPLIRYFSRLLSDWKYISFLSEINFISDIEQLVLEQMMKEKVKSVTFDFKDGLPINIEVSQDDKIDSYARISDIIAKNQYQEILLKTQAGDIAYTNIKTKFKLNK